MPFDTTTRREFLKKIGVGAAALGLGPGASAAGGVARRPNIILIMADDLGRECLGSYGGRSYSTPNLDAMAASGVRFEHCYAGPLCTPSRVQIMTGAYNFRNYKLFGTLPEREKTFGHVMQSAGYVTAAVGKWQLHQRGEGMLPAAAGFDEHCLWRVVDREGSRYAEPTLSQNGTLIETMKGRYGPDVMREFATDFIDRHRADSFFLYYPMALPHSPFEPTPDTPEWKTQQHQANNRFFGPMVGYMDKLVGRLLQHLENRRLSERTLVIFTSDNGTPRAIQSRMGDRIIRGGKGLTTDAGTHVPLITRWAGISPEGRVCSDLVDLSDFLPTLAALGQASLPANTTIDGRSFLPQVRGEVGTPREWIYCYFDPKRRKHEHVKQVYARDTRFKLYGRGELYDALADPDELSAIAPGLNAAADRSRERLQRVIDQMRREGA